MGEDVKKEIQMSASDSNYRLSRDPRSGSEVGKAVRTKNLDLGET
jgi:hypothetical protein